MEEEFSHKTLLFLSLVQSLIIIKSQGKEEGFIFSLQYLIYLLPLFYKTISLPATKQELEVN